MCKFYCNFASYFVTYNHTNGLYKCIYYMQKQHVVVRFCGDSGDGMQLTGTMFASLSAILGNEISTLPDFPAEIRAPQGTLGGVSGFQVQLGTGVYTPGDQADVIVAMNAAALAYFIASFFNCFPNVSLN